MSGSALKRLKRELKEMEDNPPPHWSAAPANDDILHWSATILGPGGSPYEDGVFLLDIQFPADYPFKGPTVAFTTKIYHPNISEGGGMSRMPVSIDPASWTPATNISVILQSIHLMLAEPTPDFPLRPDCARQCLSDKPAFERAAREHTANHAVPANTPGATREADAAEREAHAVTREAHATLQTTMAAEAGGETTAATAAATAADATAGGGVPATTIQQVSAIDPNWHRTKEWSCSVCTFVNPPGGADRADVFCCMCGSPTPIAAVIDSDGVGMMEQDKLAKAVAVLPSKALLIRIRCGKHALRNVKSIAERTGVKGLMLTPGEDEEDGEGTQGSTGDLIAAYAAIKDAHPGLWLGVNFVGENPYTVAKLLMKFDRKVDGVWIDNSYVTASDPQSVPAMMLDAFAKIPNFSNDASLYFGGVLHKGSHVPPNGTDTWFNNPDDTLEPATRNALPFMDVVCTSGFDTGIPVSVEKVGRMHAVVDGRAKLALSSGVDASNVDPLLPFVDYFIVGTSVHDDDEKVLVDNVLELHDRIASYSC